MICNLNETNSQLAPIRLPSTNNSYCCNPTTIPPYGKYEIVTSFDKQASLMTWKKVHMSKTHASTRTEELSNYKDIQNQSISSNSIESNLSSINTANPEINLTLDRQTASLPHSQSQSDHLLNQHSHLSSRNRESTTMDLKTDDETETQKLNYMKSNFPIKLYRLILSEKSDHIQWMNGGKTFQIHDINRFIKDILPKYFKGQLLFNKFYD